MVVVWGLLLAAGCWLLSLSLPVPSWGSSTGGFHVVCVCVCEGGGVLRPSLSRGPSCRPRGRPTHPQPDRTRSLSRALCVLFLFDTAIEND